MSLTIPPLLLGITIFTFAAGDLLADSIVTFFQSSNADLLGIFTDKTLWQASFGVVFCVVYLGILIGLHRLIEDIFGFRVCAIPDEVLSAIAESPKVPNEIKKTLAEMLVEQLGLSLCQLRAVDREYLCRKFKAESEAAIKQKHGFLRLSSFASS